MTKINSKLFPKKSSELAQHPCILYFSYIHFTKTQRRQRREQHSDHLRRSSIFSEFGPFAGIRARLYSKCSDTGTDDTDTQMVKNEEQRRENQVIRKRKIEKVSDDDLKSSESSSSKRSVVYYA